MTAHNSGRHQKTTRKRRAQIVDDGLTCGDVNKALKDALKRLEPDLPKAGLRSRWWRGKGD